MCKKIISLSLIFTLLCSVFSVSITVNAKEDNSFSFRYNL